MRKFFSCLFLFSLVLLFVKGTRLDHQNDHDSIEKRFLSSLKRGASPFSDNSKEKERVLLKEGEGMMNETRMTEFGEVRGVKTNDCLIWGSVPFASPPLDQLRFAKPVDPTPWAPSVLDTNTIPLPCLQLGVPSTEDCLYLNIFAPLQLPSYPLPVLIWIHGGANTNGGSEAFNASALASTERAIIVTIQYRLSVFGYSAFELDSPFEIGANFGLYDQLHAFRGESAGGGAVLHHLVNKNSWQYFSQGIMESPWPQTLPHVERTINATLSYGQLLGCKNDSQFLSCMRNIPASDMLPSALFTLGPIQSFQPSMDHHFFEDEPMVLFNRGDWKKCPILIGWNKDEHTVLGAYAIFQATKQITFPTTTLSQSDYNSSILFNFGSLEDPLSLSPFVYENYQQEEEEEGNWASFCQSIGDWGLLFRCPSLLDDGFGSSSSPVFMYFWGHTPRRWVFTPYGATHTAEIPFVFNTESEGMKFTRQEKDFASNISSAWLSFSEGNAPLSTWPDYREKNYVQPLDMSVWPEFPLGSPYPFSGVDSCLNWQPIMEKGTYPSATYY